MKINRFMVLALVAVLALTLTVPLGAQDSEYPVLILPVDQAQFLPGSLFDFRVEVHTRELPENFAVTVNGQDAAAYFSAEPETEQWSFGGNVTAFDNSGTPSADFTVDALTGDYYNATFGTVSVTVEGDTITYADGSLEPTDNPLVFTAVGGAGDGLPVAFGLDEEGAVTGFEIAGQTFGLLAGDEPTPSTSLIWRGLSAPAAGEYTIEVTAGATTASVAWTVRELAASAGAQNVILFVADGMTVPMITAARIASNGISQGTLQGEFYMDSAEYIGLAHTSSIDSVMADSANTASALNTGHIGSVNATGSYSDTSPSRLDDPRVETFGEMISRVRGMSVGSITTSDWTDATPAAVWAHGRDRGEANRAEYAVQPLDGGLLPAVIMGGGSRRLLPSTVEGSRRRDDRDVFAEYEAAGYTIVTTATEMAATTGAERMLGVFTPSDLSVWLDRNVYTENLGDFTDQPGLVEMTLAALDVLGQNENGFYLAIEAASVDKQMHPLDQERALSDLIEFDMALGAAIEWVAENAPNTLIVVTSDHGHGYDVYGTVDITEFNAAEDDAGRRNAIGLYGAAGYPTYTDEDGDGFPNWEADVTFAGTVNNHPDYTEDFQVSPVPRAPAIVNDEGVAVDNPDDDVTGIPMSGNLPMSSTSGVHTLQDVPVFAYGPGAECLNGVYHQSEIFFCMAASIGLDPSAEDMMEMDATPEATQSASIIATAGVVQIDPASAIAGIVIAASVLGGFAFGRISRKKNS